MQKSRSKNHKALRKSGISLQYSKAFSGTHKDIKIKIQKIT